jgi:PAS domain S-box-containing protein
MIKTEEQYHNYFNLGLIGMAVTSLEKGWVDVNEKLCEILGYPRKELIELSWAEITYPDDLEADVAEFERVLSGEIEGYTMDKRFFRKDGVVIYASISANCIRKDDGSIDHFVAFVQDITDRKSIEIKLNQLNAKLESLVVNRTKELEEANKQISN